MYLLLNDLFLIINIHINITTELWASNMATGLRSGRQERKVDRRFIEYIYFHPSLFLPQSLLFLSLPPVKSSMLFFRTWQQWRLREGWVTPGVVLVVCVCNFKSNADGAADSLRCFSSCLYVSQGMFEPYLKSFYIRSTDPTQIKVLKVTFYSCFSQNCAAYFLLNFNTESMKDSEAW